MQGVAKRRASRTVAVIGGNGPLLRSLVGMAAKVPANVREDAGSAANSETREILTEETCD